MSAFSCLLKVWHKPAFKRVFLFLAGLVPDKQYIKMIFRGKLGYKLNLKNPQTFNEKLNWFKLYNRQPLYTSLADKYAVKKYVADKIGEQYVVKNLGVWNSFDDIDFDSLPNQFVLKCTHDSSGALVCRDKSTFDMKSAKEKLDFVMKMNYFYACREWPYKNIPHRIIADELLDDHSGKELNDYKFWCVNGEPIFCEVISGRANGEINVAFIDKNKEQRFLNFFSENSPTCNHPPNESQTKKKKKK